MSNAWEVLVGSSCRVLGIAAMGGAYCKRKGLGDGGLEPRGGGAGLGGAGASEAVTAQGLWQV